MAGADPDTQYHLATDASLNALGGCLFQIRDVPPGTEATPTIALNERIIMFLSYRLNDAETRYSSSERECLAIVKYLAEVRWLVIGSKYPVIIYSDHEALKPIFATGQTEKGRVATWLDRLGEFDTKVVYRPSRDQHIGLADGLSRLPERMSTKRNPNLVEKLAMPVLHSEMLQQHTHPLSTLSRNGNLKKFRRSPMYHQLVDYLEGGEEKLARAEVPRNRRRALRHMAKSFRLPYHSESRHLRYIEKTGANSICIVEDQIPQFLKAAHEDYGHYAAALTLDYLIGRAYWPTRTKDVHEWYASCHSCQSRLKKPITSAPLTVQSFGPMKMLRADWLGPISPICTATGAAYVLLVVDFFSRFVWARAYQQHTSYKTIDLIREHITPVFRWPEGLYTDNGSHFVNHNLKAVLLEHGVSYFTGPISHPSSTGLLERTVQEILAQLSKKYIKRGTTNS